MLKHRGYDLFRPAVSACRAFERASERERARHGGRIEVVDAADLLLRLERFRSLNWLLPILTTPACIDCLISQHDVIAVV